MFFYLFDFYNVLIFVSIKNGFGAVPSAPVVTGMTVNFITKMIINIRAELRSRASVAFPSH